MNINELHYLPTESGCYLFKDSVGKVIYVGKAKNLKKRVSSYFQKKDHDPKTAQLVTYIRDVDFITTPTEVDALLLENNLIKKYYPYYNLDLKDSRRYAYLLLHNEDSLPYLEVVRARDVLQGEYYGPFVSGAMRKIILDVIHRNFRVFTRKPSPRLKKTVDPEMYHVRVQQARQILKGNVDELIRELKDQMKSAAGKTYYEYALTVRNQIQALQTLKEKQLIEMTRAVDAHVIAYKISGDTVYLIVFSMRRGVLEEKQSFSFTYYEEFFDDFLVQYYDTAPIPQEVIVQHAVDPALEHYLSKKGKRKVSIIVPQKGDKKELLDLTTHNITTTFFTGGARMEALQESLKLPHIPRHIECFDISHLSGTNTVASMVTFRDGLPAKQYYRKFKVRSQTGGDDYWAMREVVRRRYAGSLKETLKNPDLIVIDGGLGQLSAAYTVLKELKFKIPVISLAKKFEEIYIPTQSDPLVLDRKNKGLQLLQALRDEAHRFALSYQRSLRKSAFK